MRALVSGGAGFIGSTLVDALLARGDDVVIVDDLSTGRADNLVSAKSAGAELVAADVRDARSLQSIVAAHRPQLVFHLAAQVDVRISVSDPGRDVRVNVEGTVNMLDAAERAGAESFVFASSCAVYGDPFNHHGEDGIDIGAFPLTEDAPVRPDAPYGQGKLGAEGYVALYRNLHGLRTASLRFANVYGPRQNALGESGVVAIFCDRLASGRRPTIFGDGTQSRDFVFVDDAVAALLAAGDSGAGGEFNIGTGVETTVLEVAEKLRLLGGRDDFLPDMESARPGEIRRMALRSDRAHDVLGWQPSVDFESGLRRTLGGWSGADGEWGAGEAASPAGRSPGV